MKSEPDEDPEPDPDSMPDPDPDPEKLGDNSLSTDPDACFEVSILSIKSLPEPVELVKSWTTVHRPASYEGFEVKVAG